MTGISALQRISDDESLMFADLLRGIEDLEFDTTFPANGRFFTRSHGGRDYWYHRVTNADLAHRNGESRIRYVGACDDADIESKTRRPRVASIDLPQLRHRAETLRQRGFTSPTYMEGQVLKALSEAGVFRLRSVLIGSVAYQAYSGLLGFRLPCASLRTDDVDIAVDFGVSNLIDDTCDDIWEALRKVDPSFSPKPHLDDHTTMATFTASTGFQVEFLTTHRGSDEHTGRLSRLSSLGPHMGGVPLRYLDFLMRHPVRSVVLYETGLSVTVPAPERFAIHKLIVAASRRAGNPKISKDLAQAAELINAHAQNGWIGKVQSAWTEAWERGDTWRSRLSASGKNLDAKTKRLLP